MKKKIDRRKFLKNVAVGTGAAIGLSLEDKALLGQSTKADVAKPDTKTGKMPTGNIGGVNISRLIAGGNLISGYAHSRDLIYVSPLLKHYFTDEKIMHTWKLCEQQGVNTMIFYGNDEHAIDVYKKYRNEHGGKIQWIAQVEPPEDDIKGNIKRCVDAGAVGAFLVGNKADQWSVDNRVDKTEKIIDTIKGFGIIAGTAAHSLNTVIDIDTAGVELDFYMKTLHTDNYWSKRRPDQNKSVIDNYEGDNYWSMMPKETIETFREIKTPWIAYKVLAAGAIHPNEGFEYAFANGADFACVGMFDFQVDEDVVIARKVVANNKTRTRGWMA